MLRAALAAVVLAGSLIAATLLPAPAPAWPVVAAMAAAHVVDDCADPGGAEWHATPALAASTGQSSTWRGVPAAPAPVADACAFVADALRRSRTGARASAAPAHLRHTPLLI